MTALSVTAVVLVLTVWQLSGLYLEQIFVSTPVHVAARFGGLIKDGSLPAAFGHSAWEMLVGFVVAAVVGISLGLAMGRTRWLGRALDPWVSFANAAPAIAVLPVLEIWFGFGVFARIAFVTVLAVWTMTINTLVGTRNVGRVYGDVAKAFGLRGWPATRKVFLPAAMPYILAGARVALAQAAVGMILSGQEIGQSGLGGLAQEFASFYETANLIATIITSTGLAILAFWGLRVFQRRFFPWIGALTATRTP
jgi:ABC-type nitrate/sulfonate/bicarbonate transport system permease component